MRKRRSTPGIHETARDHFGYEELRPSQEEAIQSLLNGRDTLAVLPTGSGKSAIYQIAGSLIPGPTIVVSPLIALQRDQVDTLSQTGVRGVVLNSTLPIAEREAALNAWQQGEAEFLFLAPEQLSNDATLQLLRTVKPSLFVVDEAHCVSEWGHDFRPDYLKLGQAIEALGHPVTLALTATAAPPVRIEITERLAMREPHILVSGFNRPNIWLGARRFESAESKRDTLLSLILDTDRPGIVYAATRATAEELATTLCEAGVAAAHYHGGMKASEREDTQRAFMADEVEVVVATIAFGMGIDKPNVRFVFHYDISDSVDSYYQEIGRAGRDGETAQAILFYDPSDLNLRRFLSGGSKLDTDEVAEVVVALQNDDVPLAPAAIAAETELSKTKATVAINRLAEIGAVESLPSGEIMANQEVLAEASAMAEVVEAATAAQERHRQFERSRIEMMQGYAELRLCRRQYLLNYFGEGFESSCGFCDNCQADARTAAASSTEQPFAINSRVAHGEWGQGQVLRYEDDKMTVLFDEVGYKTLAVAIVVANNLLQVVT